MFKIPSTFLTGTCPLSGRAQDVARMATEKINPSLRRLGKRGIADYYKMENWRGGLEGIVLESVEHGR